MALKYYLLPFPLGEEKDRYRAVPKAGETLRFEALVKKMLQRGTLATKTDIMAVLTLFNEVVVSELEQGNKIITPLFTAGIRVEGTFGSSAEKSNAKKHKVHAQLQAGRQLEKALSSLSLERVEQRQRSAQITSIRNCFREGHNTAQPGDNLEIRGHYFYLNPEDPKQGIWLKSKDHLYPVEHLFRMKPSSFFLRLPADMAPGLYTIEFFGCSRRGIAIPGASTYSGLVIT